MNLIVILLALSAASFGQECDKAGPEKKKNWKLNCEGDDCSSKFTFKTEEELGKLFSEFVSEKIAPDFGSSTTSTEVVTTTDVTSKPTEGASKTSTQDTSLTSTSTQTTAGGSESAAAPIPDETSKTSSQDTSSTQTFTQTTAGGSESKYPGPDGTSKASTQDTSLTLSFTQTIGGGSNTTAVPNSNGCSLSSFIFTERLQVTDYVKYNGVIPNITEFSLCAWLSPVPGSHQVKGSLLNYFQMNGTNGSDYISVIFRGREQLKVKFHAINHVTWKIGDITSRSHLCVTVSPNITKVRVFVNGTEMARNKIKEQQYWNDSMSSIPSDGTLIVGHDQDKPSHCAHTTDHCFKQSEDAFWGKIENLIMWNRVLNETEIPIIYGTDCFCPDDAIITFNETVVDLKGNVTASFNVTCG